MNKKPWLIVALATLQILVPIFGVLLGSFFENITPYQYVKTYTQVHSALDIFEYFFLFPIAGVSIFIMKRWSFPFFVGAMIWVNVSNIQSWATGYREDWSIPILIAITLLNLTIVTYFLLPAIRRFYFKKQLRWWESKPRFRVEIPGLLEYKKLDHKCVIRDLSESGAFIESDMDISSGEQICLQVSVLNNRFPISGIIIHKRTSPVLGYGIEFNINRKEKRVVNNLIKALQFLGCNISRPEDPFLDDFLEWINGFKKKMGSTPKKS